MEKQVSEEMNQMYMNLSNRRVVTLGAYQEAEKSFGEFMSLMQSIYGVNVSLKLFGSNPDVPTESETETRNDPAQLKLEE